MFCIMSLPTPPPPIVDPLPLCHISVALTPLAQSGLTIPVSLLTTILSLSSSEVFQTPPVSLTPRLQLEAGELGET